MTDGAGVTRHVPELDGLRGIAVLMVMAVHSLAGIHFASIGRAFSFGWAGVDLFFVLSGFLITGILIATRDSPHRTRNFYARRALRIWPLYLVVLGVAYGAGPLFELGQRYTPEQIRWWPYLLFVQNFFMGVGRSVTAAWPLGITWSLAIEEQFYLVWPLLAFRLRSGALRVLLIAVLVASPVLRAGLLWSGRSSEFVYGWTFTRLDGLAAGSLVALLMMPGTLTATQLRRMFWLAAASLPVAIALALARLQGVHGVLSPLTPEYPLSIAAIFSLFAIGFAGLLGLLLQPGLMPLKRVLRSRPLRWVGTVSYALYLIHYPLFEFFRASVNPRIASSLGLEGWQSTALGMLAAYPLTFLLAWISWRNLEQPILRLKRVFSDSGMSLERSEIGGAKRVDPL